jgi:hypothetical protein
MVLVAFLLAGCGGSDGGPIHPGTGGAMGTGGADGSGGATESPLKGTWMAPLGSGQPCVSSYAFDGISVMSRGIACVLGDGSTVMELQRGSYHVAQGVQIQYSLTAATCPASEIPMRDGAIGFTVTAGGPLVLMFSDAQETLQPGTLNGTLGYGCFHGDLSKFTPSPLAPL